MIMNYIKGMRKKEKIDKLVFIVLLSIVSLITAWFFYKQAKHEGGLYKSDIEAYLCMMLGIETHDDYPYPILFKTAAFFYNFSPSPQIAMAFTVNLFNFVAIIITKLILDKQTKARLLNTFATFGLFFCSMIHGNIFKLIGVPYRYISTGSPTPWHNQTYIAGRPFMILAFVWTCYTLDTYEQDFASGAYRKKGFIWKYCIFSIFLLLSTMTKPSYTLPALFAGAFVMLYRLFKMKWSNFKQTFILALFYIPTLIDMLYQYLETFTGTNPEGMQKGIGVSVGLVWSMYTSNIPVAILLGSAFPIVVLIFNWKEMKIDTQYRFSWIFYIITIVMAIVLYEGGSRTPDFNFIWGKNAGMFLTFYTSCVILINKTCSLKEVRENIKLARCKVYTQWGLFALHVIMGVYYFGILCKGEYYL